MNDRSKTRKLSKKELNRRLGRIYSLALLAYHRAQHSPEQSQAADKRQDQNSTDERRE